MRGGSTGLKGLVERGAGSIPAIIAALDREPELLRLRRDRSNLEVYGGTGSQGSNTRPAKVSRGFRYMIGQLLVFGISFLMIVGGVVFCVYSIYDRQKAAEEQAKKIAEEIEKKRSAKMGITDSPIPLADLNDIIRALNEIKNPFLQVGMFLTVFGLILMIISIFIPF